MKKLMALLAVAAALCLSADNLLAQQDNGGGGGGGGQRRGRGGFGGDPAQRQQMMLQRYKEDLGFTNDTEWSAVEPLVTKVMDARRDQMMSMFAGFRRGGQDNGGNGGGPTDPDRDALKQAVDTGAPAAQIKTLLEKFRASQKAKQAKLEQAQADLKNVLSQKQEAAAVLAGLLN
ncbi:MAG TPA: hypothetical protein VGI88_07760 [Verrucomicrobiae bacterium]|jgi:hypothetical protein